MPRVVLESTKTEVAGYACDMCGKLISDGRHDGCCGVNWWGMHVGVHEMSEETVTVVRKWDAMKVTIANNFPFHKENRSFGVCRECAAKVIEFIEATAGRITQNGQH